MRIQELSEAAGVPAETIRYYEKADLLPLPARGENNYRVYQTSHLERLILIRNCRALDMSLQEIGTLLAFVDAPLGDCSGIDRLVTDHLAHVRSRLAELRQLEKQLKAILAACGGRQVEADCGIMTALSDQAPQTKSRKTRLQAVHASKAHE
jgi:Cd(II)/Pb(II)-responsive transcriptional regulator